MKTFETMKGIINKLQQAHQKSRKLPPIFNIRQNCGCEKKNEIPILRRITRDRERQEGLNVSIVNV
jgi:hypothetical protein